MKREKRKSVPLYSAEDWFAGKKDAEPVGRMSNPDEFGPVLVDRETFERLISGSNTNSPNEEITALKNTEEKSGNMFTIENGMVLQGYPREKPDETVLTWPDEETRYVDGELFEENAHFLFENRERIFADSRMFLAPVNVMSGAAYIGSLVKPTVGTYIEWWLRRGKDELAYFVSGSPLSGANVSKAIAKDGSLVPLPSPGIFLNLVKEFTDAHKRYIEERKKFEAYSLLEVVMRLKNIDPSYEDAFRAKVLERRKSVLEKVVGVLKNALVEVKRRCQSYKDKYKNCLRHNQENGAGEAGEGARSICDDVAS